MARDVFQILSGIVNGWGQLVVRVKQDGKMQFMTLGEVRDQRLVLKIVRDLIKQAVKEEGISNG